MSLGFAIKLVLVSSVYHHLVPVCIIEDQNVCCEERFVRNVIIVLKFNRIREPPFA